MSNNMVDQLGFGEVVHLETVIPESSTKQEPGIMGNSKQLAAHTQARHELAAQPFLCSG